MSNSFNYKDDKSFDNNKLAEILSKVQGLKLPKEKTVLEHPVILKELAKINHALYLSHLDKWIAIVQQFIARGQNIANLEYEMTKMREKRYNKSFKDLSLLDQNSFMVMSKTEIKALSELLVKIEKLG